jgi:hypothetical protein
MPHWPLTDANWTVSELHFLATDFLCSGCLSDANSLCFKVKVKVILRPTVSRQVCLGTKHAFGANDQILIIVWQLRVSWFGAPSLTRGRVCGLQLLLGLASVVFLGSESLRTRGHILLSQIWDYPFRRLLRLAGSRWRYSTPPPHSLRRYTYGERQQGRYGKPQSFPKF